MIVDFNGWINIMALLAIVGGVIFIFLMAVLIAFLLRRM
jgi:hypothetical protein